MEDQELIRKTLIQILDNQELIMALIDSGNNFVNCSKVQNAIKKGEGLRLGLHCQKRSKPIKKKGE
jgi:hypothetical protein